MPWVIKDDYDYEDIEISDDEFAERRARAAEGAI